MKRLKELQHLGLPIKLIKKPVVVLAKCATEPGKVTTSWGQILEYEKNDYIIRDKSGDTWAIRNHIYKSTYIDAQTIEELITKWEKNPLLEQDENFTIKSKSIENIKKYLKQNSLLNSKKDDELFAIKKIVISDAIVTFSAGEIETAEGIVKYSAGDFIVSGAKDEVWPIKKEKVITEYLSGNNDPTSIFNNWIENLE